MNTLQTPEHVPSNSLRWEFTSPLICSLLAAHNPIISPRAPHLGPHAWLCHGVCSAQYDEGYSGCSPNPRLLPKSQTAPHIPDCSPYPRLGRWDRAEPAPRQRPGLPLVQRHSSHRVTRDMCWGPTERDTSWQCLILPISAFASPYDELHCHSRRPVLFTDRRERCPAGWHRGSRQLLR